jgi:hypothetical protein
MLSWQSFVSNHEVTKVGWMLSRAKNSNIAYQLTIPYDNNEALKVLNAGCGICVLRSIEDYIHKIYFQFLYYSVPDVSNTPRKPQFSNGDCLPPDRAEV